MYASPAFTSNAIFATRPKFELSLLFGACPGVPYWARNFPSCVNLRMCESPAPFPPIQTLSLSSSVTPWLELGHWNPSPGPPHAFTRLPSGSNSRMGGAERQHSPMGGVAFAPASVRWFSVESPRWMMNTWSRESTPTPIVEPRIQWLGSGLGHMGSTSNRGA